jgi:hypothetical protein
MRSTSVDVKEEHGGCANIFSSCRSDGDTKWPPLELGVRHTKCGVETVDEQFSWNVVYE